MQLFYLDSLPDEGKTIVLDAENSRHALKVLRKRVGDELLFTDGNGHSIATEIVSDHFKDCQARVKRLEKKSPAYPHKLNLVVAPTKSLDRMEWMVEKATEIGASSITFIETKYAERGKLKIDRLRKTAISAMKQSLQFYLPEIDGIVTLNEFLQRQQEGHKCIAWMEAGKSLTLTEFAKACNSDITVLIGSEGGFSYEEVQLSQNAGYHPVSLGPTRLRTETAAIFACTTLRALQIV